MMQTVHAFALIVAGLLAGAGMTFAASPMDEATANATAKSAVAQTQAAPTQVAPTAEKKASMAMPATANEVVLSDPEARQRYLAAMQGYYEYMANGYAYRSRVFEWQLLSSRLIFIVVLTLVAAGMYFAAVQFRLAMRAAVRPHDAARSDVPGPGLSLATQLEFSAKGVVVNSSVMGLIILALSLAFFYLYLVYVYPVNDVF